MEEKYVVLNCFLTLKYQILDFLYNERVSAADDAAGGEAAPSAPAAAVAHLQQKYDQNH